MKLPWTQDTDNILACPRCGSHHYFSVRRIYTSVVRNGEYVCLDTGSEHLCLCGHNFAATSDGIREISVAAPQYQNSTATGDKPPVVRLTPRERKSGV